MTGPTAVTVITRRYLPHARVLAASLSEHHPSSRLIAVIVDEPRGADRREPFDVLSPFDLVDEGELHRRALLFDEQGLISSLRPLAISHLLETGAESVLLLDSDMLVLGPLDDLARLAADSGVLLSPHIVRSAGGGPGAWEEERYLIAGTFNGGFLGVGRAGHDFLAWMSARVARDCYPDPRRGLLYSQTWLDLVPALFPHHILRDEGVNVTAHSLAGRDLDQAQNGWSVEGTLVRLFHFTGFDPDEPTVLSRHLPDERGTVEGRPHLAELCNQYARRLRERGWPATEEYGWARLPGGLVVDERLKTLYRDAVADAEAGLADEPPDPLATSGDFVAWPREKAPNFGVAAAQATPEVSVLVPTHNAFRFCRRLLRSLRNTRNVAYEVIVVDNASRWPTRTYLRAMRWQRRVHKLVLNERNLLFAAANNQAARNAHPASRYVLMLNSDVEIEHPLWLRRLLDVHRRGASGYGLIEDAAGTRADGYCLLVDRDLYDHYGLDERYAWWWCTSKLQAELLRDGYAVRAVREHDHLLRHHQARSGDDFFGAPGMDTDPATVRAWFAARSAEVLSSVGR